MGLQQGMQRALSSPARPEPCLCRGGAIWLLERGSYNHTASAPLVLSHPLAQLLARRCPRCPEGLPAPDMHRLLVGHDWSGYTIRALCLLYKVTLVAQNLPAMQLDPWGRERSPEKGMATHSCSCLGNPIEESDGLQFMASQRVRHD